MNWSGHLWNDVFYVQPIVQGRSRTKTANKKFLTDIKLSVKHITTWEKQNIFFPHLINLMNAHNLEYISIITLLYNAAFRKNSETCLNHEWIWNNLKKFNLI